MYRGRGLLFPLLLIGIGFIVLLVNTGVLSQDALQRLGALWALLLVILGLQLILNHTLPRRQATWVGLAATVIIVTTAVLYASLAPAASLATRQADVSERLGGLTTATLDLNYSGATVEVQGGTIGDALYRAHVDYPGGENPPTFSLDHESGAVAIRESSGFSGFHLFGSNRRHVLVTLTDQIPWTVTIGGGAANLRLDLRRAAHGKERHPAHGARSPAGRGLAAGTGWLDLRAGADQSAAARDGDLPTCRLRSGGTNAARFGRVGLRPIRWPDVETDRRH